MPMVSPSLDAGSPDSIGSEKHAALHWEYQEAMEDHRGESLKHVLEHGQDEPEDLKSSEVHHSIDDCNILLYCSAFKRNFQLQEALPMHVSQTWPWRRRATWCIFYANSDMDLWEWAKTCFSFPLQCGLHPS